MSNATAKDPSTRILDHIVHITPPGTLPQAVQAFRELGFTVIDGGEHADGQTANALIILADGTYLELIHFLLPSPSPSSSAPAHQWANKPPGFSAFAFLGAPSSSPSIDAVINARSAALGIAHELHYREPVRGGRTRPDGVELRWEIVVPERWSQRRDAMGRPFFCGDLTRRELRVPPEEEKHTHANKTRGIAYLRVLVSPAAFGEKVKEFEAVFGVPPIPIPVSPSSDGRSEREWELETPTSTNDKETAVVPPKLIVTAANEEDEEEARFVQENGTGVFEVGFVVGEG
ncbi:hypothetical protein BDW22DRAFT_1207813 [Trametopsis cervina]|nr:hypothetical protein BDW22DRAFT_1207813 [Trametopsis cervina]